MTEYVDVGRWRTRDAVYHTTDCPRHPDDATTVTREEAEERGLRECKYCSGEAERPRNGNTEIYEAALEWEANE